MVLHPQRSTLFPYTTLFRSCRGDRQRHGAGAPALRDRLRLDAAARSEEHTSELQSLAYLVFRLLLEKKETANDFNRRDSIKLLSGNRLAGNRKRQFLAISCL